ncbi:WecB/TagA/CpsF family glycosyltransferase [Gordonia sp. SCSIO 19800]|uniref:WecB/TagA/CpsF family glycosyltransferase n=1 Tax=Gordonia sp. SCSIO 19800 TaxID=2826926 RepID=UPI0024AEEE84|nr:WecB/TagA/CpsF family glycosyltransferase [Gordonia sp. SCSIO 19800]
MSGVGSTYPDGAPVVWFMRLFSGSRRPSRVRGPSLFRRVLDKSRDTGLRHMFVGATDETLTRLTKVIDDEYPGVKVGGAYAPPFEPVSDSFIDDIARAVCHHDCDLVWIGLGTPKQDLVAALLAERVNAPCVGVGAAFDFVAGTVPEAPVLFQRLGLEWLYRFASEPRRLWRRYTIGNLRFLFAVARSKLNQRAKVR